MTNYTFDIVVHNSGKSLQIVGIDSEDSSRMFRATELGKNQGLVEMCWCTTAGGANVVIKKDYSSLSQIDYDYEIRYISNYVHIAFKTLYLRLKANLPHGHKESINLGITPNGIGRVPPADDWSGDYKGGF